MCIASKRRDVNVKVYMITKTNDAKILINIFPVIVNSIEKNVVQIKKWIIRHVNTSVKIIAHAKKIKAGISVHVFSRIVGIWKVLLMNK